MPTHQWIRDLTAGTGIHKDVQLFIKSTKTWLCFPAMNIWADTRFFFTGLFSCRIILSGWIVFMNTVSAWLSVSRRSFLTDFCSPSDKQKRPACTFLKAHQTLEIIAFYFLIFFACLKLSLSEHFLSVQRLLFLFPQQHYINPVVFHSGGLGSNKKHCF